MAPRLRSALAAALVCVLAFAVLAALAEPPPAHGDFAEDYLAARDCAEAIRCESRGPHASVEGYDHGALWLWTLVGAQRLGLGFGGLQAVVLLALAMGVGLVFLVGRRLVGGGGGLVAAATYLWMLLVFVEYDVLWNVAPLPALFVLSLAVTIGFARRGGRGAAALAGGALALAASSHLVAFALAPALLGLTAWLGRRALSATLFALGGLAGASLLLSWRASLDNLAQLAAGPGLAVAGLALGLAALAGLLARRRWPARRLSSRAWLPVVAVLATVALLAPALWLVFGRAPEPRFLSAALPALALAAAGLVAWRARSRRAWGLVALVLVALLGHATLGRLAQAEGPVGRQARGCAWTLPDAERLAAWAYADPARGYPALWRSLDGPRVWHLLGALACVEPAGRPRDDADGPSRPPRERQQLVKLPRAEAAALMDVYEAVPLPDDAVALVVPVTSWLRREDARVCCQPAGAGPRLCAPLGEAAWEVEGVTPFAHHDRARPRLRLPDLPCRQGRYRLDYEIPVDPVEGEARVLQVFDIDKAARWQVSAVEGLAVPETLPAAEVSLAGPARGPVVLRLSRDFGEAGGDDRGALPDLLETSRDGPAATLRAAVRRHYP